MEKKSVSWGILGAANIAAKAVIPGMKRSKYSIPAAIASRNSDKARTLAAQYGIPRHYGSYEDLLNDKEIDAVYIPLPNHLHVEWSRKALEAGKHVLCEKPIALNAGDVHSLMTLRDSAKLKIGEAFMVHTHPQWIKAKSIVKSQRFGQLRAVQGFFSYYNLDKHNVRNRYPSEEGGGALWDIGCYPIHTSRFMFDEEPKRVFGLMEEDPDFHTDRLTSAILDFPSGQAVFISSTQVVPWQRMNFFGEKQRLEIEIPFNQPADIPARIFLDNAAGVTAAPEDILLPPANQYMVEADEFSLAILENRDVPVPLENSLYNTAIITALFRSMKSGTWEQPIVK